MYENAIHIFSKKKVKAYPFPEAGENWYLVEFENNVNLNVHGSQLEFPDREQHGKR